jgi:endoplasmic reticulum Man9GlcNAc2 1,2-alpha-mannosidase
MCACCGFFSRSEFTSISSWKLIPKQDHLVCFLGGSLMLGAVASATVPVSIPPRSDELPDHAKRDWKTGVELVETCVRTYDTQT